MAITTHAQKVMMRLKRLTRQHINDALYRDTRPVSIEAWKVGGEPVDFDTASHAEYRPFQVGESWGAAWDTWWFHASGAIPEAWAAVPDTRPELLVDLGRIGLGPGFQAEGLVRRTDGTVIKAIEPYNGWVPVPDPGQPFEFYIEAAANPEISNGEPYLPTDLGDEGVKDGPELYRLKRLELGLLDLQVWNLLQEFQVLAGLAEEIDPTRTRYAEILIALERAMDSLDTTDIAGTAQTARQCLVDVLSAPAAKGHTVYSVGHAHIDTAWLWPLRETRRKVARTFSNVVELADEDPSLVFAASSAQQYKWLKENYPDVFAGVKRKIADGQFVPVGGMWVECDANLPGGESLVRQFVQGSKFFKEATGVVSPVAWLPDSFGYSGAFPQIARLAGCKYFLTQKISWNDTNTFPHHSFLWQGIDGTEIFTHFPPSDTYNSNASPADVARSEKQYSEKGKGSSSLLLFGWGDGGGGPTREMLAAAKLQANLEGSPRVNIVSPVEFFEHAEAELSDPPRWVGELYLELHRGTSTSETNTKQGNRRSESLLREAELWATAAAVQANAPYPYDELEDIWQKVLLYQFHDILPGSAIAWVYAEVERSYRQIEIQLERIIADSIATLAGTGDDRMAANAGPIAQLGVASSAISKPDEPKPVNVVRDGEQVTLSTDAVSFTVDGEGRVVSAYDKRAGRESIDPSMPGNVLQLFVDAPAQWDAWDVDRTYERMQLDPASVDSCTVDDQGVIHVAGTIGNSDYTQFISVDPEVDALRIRTHVDWRESDRLLKQAFPVAVFAKEATSEIQFGHLSRSIVSNTSWDEARFETAAQRWAHVQEGDFGVSLANHTSYGHDIRQIMLTDGRPGTQIRVSLLRATHFPVPHADVGAHDFEVLLGVGTSIGDAIRQGYRLNVPAREVHGAHEVPATVTVDGGAVLVESVKLAEDRSGDVIVRLYESSGSYSQAAVEFGFPWSEVSEVGLLEEPCDAVQPAIVSKSDDGRLDLSLHAFQIVTLRVRRN